MQRTFVHIFFRWDTQIDYSWFERQLEMVNPATDFHKFDPELFERIEEDARQRPNYPLYSITFDKRSRSSCDSSGLCSENVGPSAKRFRGAALSVQSAFAAYEE